ncbi:Dehydroquinate synthase-like protein [Hyaloscypha hepaticicola]|uniref:Dehydroquinate synthase-like protein n=1 Tax=Hyaloscypha hepaticicola TaxID=2082293 RepID=A0A2J6Q611_9HELO|nr:Dehydroquinate synthase-like protein [Hyaloscypha hepaticicola]
MANFFASGETYRRAYDDQPLPMISYGLRFSEACAKELERLGSSRPYVLASQSLAKTSDSLEKLKQSLGEKIVGVRIGVGAHTPISECLEMISEIRELDGGVDCLITVGGGSVTDAAKLVRFALANDAFTDEEVNTLWGGHSHNPKQRKDIKLPTIPLICIPTSLSGGEYQSIAGATETLSHAKRTFEPKVNPTLTIQDPEICLLTLQWLWLSSGIRAVDHCVETLCSLQSNDKGDEEARKGLIKLVPGLLRCKHDPSDIEARHLCQLGVVEAMSAVSSGVPLGASHAIGHQLGPLGVGHGETSCILLPAVCKYNASKGANNKRQEAVAELLLKDKNLQEILKGRDLKKFDLGDILYAIIGELGLPQTLKAVNVGRDKLDGLAVNSLHDIWIRTNAVPMTEKSQVMEVLEMVVD